MDSQNGEDVKHAKITALDILVYSKCGESSVSAVQTQIHQLPSLHSEVTLYSLVCDFNLCAVKHK